MPCALFRIERFFVQSSALNLHHALLTRLKAKLHAIRNRHKKALNHQGLVLN